MIFVFILPFIFVVFISVIITVNVVKNFKRAKQIQNQVVEVVEQAQNETPQADTYIFCEYCGTKLKESATKCTSCGANVSKKL